ncbi:hypothetical protein JHD50_03350 [Sulfurimonas sp. MAG313]|nr:hypothetical protein [Sulfurimonas sp. MAG313]MDF1880349.1 hypothetical protein [Sulfurimonas sp. MAG313]
MSEFLVQVREKSIEAVHNADIKALYDLVEMHHEDLNDEIEQGLYGNILELALELLTNALESKDKLSLENEQQRYTLRALYEYAISHYSSKHFNDARALFEVLEGVSKEKEFIESMRFHSAAAALDIEIDDFLDKFCIVNEKLDDFYIKEFQEEAQNLLSKVNDKKEVK